jgi:hypothetical protein
MAGALDSPDTRTARPIRETKRCDVTTLAATIVCATTAPVPAATTASVWLGWSAHRPEPASKHSYPGLNHAGTGATPTVGHRAARLAQCP